MWFTFLLAAQILSFPSQAHEGHDTPGALPPAPNGGRVQEAQHKKAHAPDAKEPELFFEAVYKDKKLSVYPLSLGPVDMSLFKAVSPKSELQGVTLKVENARSKKVETLTAKITDSAIEAAFDPKDGKRFIVYVSALHNGEAKDAKIQVEKN